jgi:hypothetical protein
MSKQHARPAAQTSRQTLTGKTREEPKYEPQPSQAERVIAKFGGARDLARAFQAINKPKDPSTIFKWTYPKSKGGTGGLIPTRVWPDVMAAARYSGVFITIEDLDPRPKRKGPRWELS